MIVALRAAGEPSAAPYAATFAAERLVYLGLFVF
jgi:hypothetical protein